MTLDFEPVLLTQLFIILCAGSFDFVELFVYNNKKEMSMNLLFERIKLQAQFSRLYHNLDPAVADDVIAQAWQIERTRPAKTHDNAKALLPHPSSSAAIVDQAAVVCPDQHAYNF